MIDFEAIDVKANRIGAQTFELWREIVNRARDELDNRPKEE
ncbi:MAG: hypothetical protein PVJ21_05605 [Anaerolineales bacterium]|jgi:hypothetical protein